MLPRRVGFDLRLLCREIRVRDPSLAGLDRLLAAAAARVFSVDLRRRSCFSWRLSADVSASPPLLHRHVVYFRFLNTTALQIAALLLLGRRSSVPTVVVFGLEVLHLLLFLVVPVRPLDGVVREVARVVLERLLIRICGG
nr:hypothetical protein Iba_chr05eCG1900 [Ipomoea batatas]